MAPKKCYDACSGLELHGKIDNYQKIVQMIELGKKWFSIQEEQKFEDGDEAKALI